MSPESMGNGAKLRDQCLARFRLDKTGEAQVDLDRSDHLRRTKFARMGR
jgi:hypothetical protein